MSISLSKGQKISLSKNDGPTLDRISVGLGWGKKKGFLFKKDVDLDASCILYDGNQTPVDAVFFGHLMSEDGSVVHTGDDRAGGGSDQDPNEVINVFLKQVPDHVNSIVFVVNSYSGETFKGIPFAFCNVTDASTSQEVARYNLATDGGDYKGFVIAKVHREGGGWQFQAIGEKCTGRQQTIRDIEPQARVYA